MQGGVNNATQYSTALEQFGIIYTQTHFACTHSTVYYNEALVSSCVIMAVIFYLNWVETRQLCVLRTKIDFPM